MMIAHAARKHLATREGNPSKHQWSHVHVLELWY